MVIEIKIRMWVLQIYCMNNKVRNKSTRKCSLFIPTDLRQNNSHKKSKRKTPENNEKVGHINSQTFFYWYHQSSSRHSDSQKKKVADYIDKMAAADPVNLEDVKVRTIFSFTKKLYNLINEKLSGKFRKVWGKKLEKNLSKNINLNGKQQVYIRIFHHSTSR